jgi:pimeloyl-ACP methyl ester carboxylesterase
MTTGLRGLWQQVAESARHSNVPRYSWFSLGMGWMGYVGVQERSQTRLICPERPGYGLSSLKKKYNTLDHALDVQSLLDYLAVEQYKTIGVSGGGPYAVALAHIASRSQVLGTLLMAPATPVEASRLGQSISIFFFEMLVLLLPRVAKARTQ